MTAMGVGMSGAFAWGAVAVLVLLTVVAVYAFWPRGRS